MYNPSFFLGALGSGGLSVTFFLMLMFWIPHPNQPIPVFEDWMNVMVSGTLFNKAVVSLALMGIAILSITHFKLLVKNLKKWSEFKKTDHYKEFVNQGSGITQMAVYLTLAMSINAAFIVGAIFVPNLWSVVEYLFPLAVIAFALVGFFAVKAYAGIVVVQNSGKGVTGSKITLLPAFAFSMISVGFAAPAAMSHIQDVQAISTLLSLFFASLAGWVVFQNLGSSYRSIHQDGIDDMALPTLWIMIPVLTILMIAGIRLEHGMHNFCVSGCEGNGVPTSALVLGIIFFMQTAMLFTGYMTKRSVNFFERIKNGEFNVPATYGLICPGVAYAVSLHFFINKGLVASHFIEKFGVVYWSLSAIAVGIALFTLKFYVDLLRRIEK